MGGSGIGSSEPRVANGPKGLNDGVDGPVEVPNPLPNAPKAPARFPAPDASDIECACEFGAMFIPRGVNAGAANAEVVTRGSGRCLGPGVRPPSIGSPDASSWIWGGCGTGAGAEAEAVVTMLDMLGESELLCGGCGDGISESVPDAPMLGLSDDCVWSLLSRQWSRAGSAGDEI
jgi:hypothetical protein